MLSRQAGAEVTGSVGSSIFVLNGEIIVRVEIATRRHPKRGRPSWKVNVPAGADFVLLGRLDPTTSRVLDFWILPRDAFDGRPIYLKDTNICEFAPYHYFSLEAAFFLAPNLNGGSIQRSLLKGGEASAGASSNV